MQMGGDDAKPCQKWGGGDDAKLCQKWEGGGERRQSCVKIGADAEWRGKSGQVQCVINIMTVSKWCRKSHVQSDVDNGGKCGAALKMVVDA